MKKLIISMVLAVLLVFSTIPAFAASEVKEAPDVKVVIDGKLGTFKGSPLLVNGRTMLPMVEILSYLGVPNDKQHIIWNGTDKSITILQNEKKIVLKIGDKKAYIDDAAVTIDAAPVLYKSRTYIPASFVATTLGKKVAWDGSSKMVLIRDMVEYNRVREIMEKTDTALKKIGTMEMDMTAGVKMRQGTMEMDTTTKLLLQIDKLKKRMYMNMDLNMILGSFKTEGYLIDGMEYTLDPMSSEWEKKVLTPEEYEKLFQENDSTDVLKFSNALYAGLVLDETNPDKFVLKGDVFMSGLAAAGDLQSGSDMKIAASSMEITIDKTTYMMESINMKFAGEVKTGNEVQKMEMDSTILIKDLDGKLEITLPAEVQQKAVEVIE
jgi:hypothetical protein